MSAAPQSDPILQDSFVCGACHNVWNLDDCDTIASAEWCMNLCFTCSHSYPYIDLPLVTGD